jgi:hypothetical protein
MIYNFLITPQERMCSPDLETINRFELIAKSNCRNVGTADLIMKKLK